MFVIFISPIVLSWLVYLFHDRFHFKTANAGTLIKPPIQLSEVMTMRIHDRKWQIIFSIHDCHPHLETILFTLHQLRKALGEDQMRVELRLWNFENCQIMPTYDFQAVTFTSKQRRDLQKKLEMGRNQIFLVDPLGNLFMSYSVAAEPMGIYQDMKKVLVASQIG